jgi:hypothetical protein
MIFFRPKPILAARGAFLLPGGRDGSQKPRVESRIDPAQSQNFASATGGFMLEIATASPEGSTR